MSDLNRPAATFDFLHFPDARALRGVWHNPEEKRTVIPLRETLQPQDQSKVLKNQFLVCFQAWLLQNPNPSLHDVRSAISKYVGDFPLTVYPDPSHQGSCDVQHFQEDQVSAIFECGGRRYGLVNNTVAGRPHAGFVTVGFLPLFDQAARWTICQF